MFPFKHLPKVCMTYSTHFWLSMELSAMYFVGGTCALVHAIIPDLLCNSSTVINKKITEKLKSSGCNPEVPKPTDSEKQI